MNARWYNPVTGSFVSGDTLNGTPVPSAVDGNPYAYAGGNPVTGTDPTGHSAIAPGEGGGGETGFPGEGFDLPDPFSGLPGLLDDLLGDGDGDSAATEEETVADEETADANSDMAEEEDEQRDAETADAESDEAYEEEQYSANDSGTGDLGGDGGGYGDGGGGGSGTVEAPEPPPQDDFASGEAEAPSAPATLLDEPYVTADPTTPADDVNGRIPASDQITENATDDDKGGRVSGLKESAGTGGTNASNGAGGDASADEAEDSCTVGGQSFTAGTKVLLADGKAVPISHLKPGEKVLATNTKTGRTQAEPVTAVLVHHDTDLYDLKIRDHGKTSVIGTTSSHLFWIPGADRHAGRWAKAGSLKYGAYLRTPSGDDGATVLGGWVPRQRDGWMWDLTVPGNNDHDFYIDTTVAAVLVHNVGGAGPCQTGKAGEDAAGIDKNTQTINISGRARIPDELNGTTNGEVKNVAYQYLSSQLKDSLAFAQQNGLAFKLYVRASTQLSVEALVRSGAIARIDILP